jgi:hypothetical protein
LKKPAGPNAKGAGATTKAWAKTRAIRAFAKGAPGTYKSAMKNNFAVSLRGTKRRSNLAFKVKNRIATPCKNKNRARNDKIAVFQPPAI